MAISPSNLRLIAGAAAIASVIDLTMRKKPTKWGPSRGLSSMIGFAAAAGLWLYAGSKDKAAQQAGLGGFGSQIDYDTAMRMARGMAASQSDTQASPSRLGGTDILWGTVRGAGGDPTQEF
jgi:hypothetical protein